MKTTKTQIEKVTNKLDLTIGCYHSMLESLTQKELNKVLANIEGQADTDVTIKKKAYVVEIDIVDNEEIDFNVLTKEEFINRYGDERYDRED